MELTLEREAEIVKALAYKSSYEVGLQFEFDKHYKDSKAIRNSVMNIYRKVKKSPEKYNVSTEVLSVIADAMGHRNVLGAKREVAVAEKEIEGGSIRDLVMGVRDKSWRLIDRKLQRASKSNKRLDAVSFRDLGTLAGISFDKSQIINGQATEHIALKSDIPGNIDPVAALDLVLRMREANVASKQKQV